MKIKRRSGDMCVCVCVCVEENKRKKKRKEKTYGWKKNEEIRKNKI